MAGTHGSVALLVWVALVLWSLLNHSKEPRSRTRSRRRFILDMAESLELTPSIPRCRTANRRLQAASARRGKLG
ncbi:hypothetical protein DPMN_020521 [Dreissena polymorpha]|uniref:Uncharacterized protein n=1 Tax=Dreissena polymorpha TaxID=45954 RepID=A0A9D4NJ10_DREPO|nr:hypothetical protein DPMN_020521 [Dreissena polymorpha]